MVLGVACAFLNLPGYAAGMYVGLPRLLALFVVAGATCGLWIAWQAYRNIHPEAGCFPQYRLSTLLMLVIAWGVVLALFTPA
jgi:hypothetical protein